MVRSDLESVLDGSLDSLLADWHRWCAQEIHGTGYPAETPACRLYRVSRQWDDANGALDQDADNLLMAGVNYCVSRLHDPHRTAIHIHARNLACRVSVWRSARLPADDMARAIIVAEARTMMLRELQAEGLV